MFLQFSRRKEALEAKLNFLFEVIGSSLSEKLIFFFGNFSRFFHFMAKTREQKQAMLKELSDEILTQSSLVFANYSGLKVSETQLLRKQLREQNATLRVVKKTLFHKALAESDIQGKSDLRLDGEVAVAIAQKDETAPARVMVNFHKDHEHLSILAGVLEHAVISKDKVEMLAMIPSRTELIGMFVGSIHAPIRNFVGVGASLLRQFVGTLEAVKNSKS